MTVSASPVIAAAPIIARTEGWADYALIDSGDGRKLERYGQTTVVRPEPQCWWSPRLDAETWARADAVFDPTDEDDAGRWRLSRPMPETWPLAWDDVRFNARLTSFRHLAFFSEQGANWRFIDERVRHRPSPPRVLNLFGYTGVASLAASAAGASVTHVDASKKSVGWARGERRPFGSGGSPNPLDR